MTTDRPGDAGRQSWLIIGANGMLGHDLITAAAAAGHDVTGLGRPEVDITAPQSVASALESVPDVVVNAAAFTAVDAAEEQEELALRVNGDGPRNLARAARELVGTRLVHISTDYVFSGDATQPYPEDAAAAPRSVYGRTKLAGEVGVREELPERGIIVRTAWLYGQHGPNFVRTMLALEATRPHISVVDDQWGQPTWSRDLAEQIVALVGTGVTSGVFHGTSSGQTTWYGLAREVFHLAGADPARVWPTTTDAFPRPAPRPAFSVLGHDAWASVGMAPIRHWRAALAEALPLLRGVSV